MNVVSSSAAKPLRGLTVAITGSRRAAELARLIAGFGGIPYVAPTVGIEGREDSPTEAAAFIRAILEGGVDYAVFMTGPGVYSLMSAADSLGLKQRLVEGLKRVTVVGRSFKPKKALIEHGVETQIIPAQN
jgi:uroporphyrinogen-III synthase